MSKPETPGKPEKEDKPEAETQAGNGGSGNPLPGKEGSE